MKLKSLGKLLLAGVVVTGLGVCLTSCKEKSWQDGGQLTWEDILSMQPEMEQRIKQGWETGTSYKVYEVDVTIDYKDFDTSVLYDKLKHINEATAPEKGYLFNFSEMISIRNEYRIEYGYEYHCDDPYFFNYYSNIKVIGPGDYSSDTNLIGKATSITCHEVEISDLNYEKTIDAVPRLFGKWESIDGFYVSSVTHKNMSKELQDILKEESASIAKCI